MLITCSRRFGKTLNLKGDYEAIVKQPCECNDNFASGCRPFLFREQYPLSEK